MNITEIRVKPIGSPDDHLVAFCDITLDNQFVIRDIRLIRTEVGFIVAMPSRKSMNSCPNCSAKNYLGANYCNQCGQGLPKARDGEQRLHHDIAHPTNAESRAMVELAIIEEYQRLLGNMS